jgi:phage-related protein
MRIQRWRIAVNRRGEFRALASSWPGLHGEIKTPPFTDEGRKEAGDLLRFLQEGERLGMPQAEPLPIIGPRCGAIRVRDGEHNWRIIYRIDQDAVLVVEVYPKKTRKIPQEVIDRCKRRLKAYDDVARKARKEAAAKPIPKRRGSSDGP